MRNDRLVLTFHWNVSPEQSLGLSLFSLGCDRGKSRQKVCLLAIPPNTTFMSLGPSSSCSLLPEFLQLPSLADLILSSLISGFKTHFFCGNSPTPFLCAITDHILMERMNDFCVSYSRFFHHVYDLCIPYAYMHMPKYMHILDCLFSDGKDHLF